MGCEAQITIARVREGEYLMSDETYPTFVVREPVAVIPAQRVEVGRKWLNFETMDGEWNQWLVLMANGDAEFVVVPETCVGLIVVARRMVWPETRAKWEGGSGVETPGCVPWDELKATWAKITPGRWLVTAYFESGTREERHYTAGKVPGGVVVGEKVSWELWT